jgi:hypothetical protein
MSTEAERRIKALERRMFGMVKPCTHSMVVLHDPTDEEIDAVFEELAKCPGCREIGPTVVAIPSFARLFRERRNRLGLT